MPNLVLGVTGSIAAYRAADLARELMRSGFTVRVCLTESAAKFVQPALFEALTGNPCLVSAFDEPVTGRMAHIDWAREADLIVVAPATAHSIVRLAHGLAEDMLTTLVVASAAPLVVAPAMNPHMWASESNREALAALRARAAAVVEPLEGDVACGEHGQGKLAGIPAIVDACLAVHRRSQSLKGKRVLVTSGPTQEPIDDVRFLTNRSSGKMGAALARAAMLMGAGATVVAGPSTAPYPLGAEVVRVRTAQQMLDAALPFAPDADLIVGAAAVADYRPAHPVRGKLRRGTEPTSLNLVPNPDVLAELARAAKPGAVVAAFAAEPDDGLEKAREKLARKRVAAIAVNDVSQPGIGFDAEENALTLVWADGCTDTCGRQSKLACALWLLERLAGSG